MNAREKAIEALERAKANASGCTCTEAYRSRGMSSPDCASCDFHETMQHVDEAIAALRSEEGEAPRDVMGVALTDEEIERVANDIGRHPWDKHGEIGKHEGVIFRDGIKTALRYARDHYLSGSPAQGKQADPLAWIYEDQLPDGYPYHEMFPHSDVIDGVRMFPVFAPAKAGAQADLTELLEAGEAIGAQLGLFTNEYGDGQDMEYLFKMKNRWDRAKAKIQGTSNTKEAQPTTDGE